MGSKTGVLSPVEAEGRRPIEPLMQDTYRFDAGYECEVPRAAPQDCGNYLLHDLPMAKWESAKYLHEVLEQMTEENMNYPEKAE